MSEAWLPAQPPFMSIAAFVHLLFSAHCYVCSYLWHLYICLTSSLVDLWAFYANDPRPVFGSRLQEMYTTRVSSMPVESGLRAPLTDLGYSFVWYGKAAEQVRAISSDLSDAILHPTTFSNHFVVYDSSQ